MTCGIPDLGFCALRLLPPALGSLCSTGTELLVDRSGHLYCPPAFGIPIHIAECASTNGAAQNDCVLVAVVGNVDN